MIDESEPGQELLRIERVSVEGLFGLYDHTIPLNIGDRVTIIHGPNGVGKTKLLSWIDALFRLDISAFAQVPFRRFSVELTGGVMLEVVATIDTPTTASQEHGEDSLTLTLRGRDADGNAHEYGFTPLVVRVFEALSSVPELFRVTSDEWFEEHRNRVISTGDALATYLPRSVLFARRLDPPAWFKEITDQVDVTLIETDRLTPRERTALNRKQGKRVVKVVSAVEDCSLELLREIRENLAEYARTSQRLDQAFPQRLIQHSNPDIDVDDLKQKMIELDDARDQLAGIGLLREDDLSHPFDVHAIDGLEQEKRSVLAVYVENTTAKLATLAHLAEHIQLLLDHTNEKFTNKRLSIDPKAGLVAADNGGRPLKLDDLSSGEQHEIVLLHNLLFNVRPNTLVLIDEPELSLHITWQKRFLDDLLQIAKTAELDALVATHSPFIIGEREDLMVPLEATPAQRLTSQ